MSFTQPSRDKKNESDLLYSLPIEKKSVPYGTWPSPITAKMAAGSSKKYDSIFVSENGDVYWIESRPSEGGRSVIVCKKKDGAVIDCISAPYNARTRVHEYGGAAYTVYNNVLYFVNFTDQIIYSVEGNNQPKALTKPGCRFANLIGSKNGLVAVGEVQDGNEVNNFLALINLANGEYTKLASGYDFYSFPVFNSTQDKLAWICWNHPNMPWDGTELWIADFNLGALSNSKKIAGNETESIFQPQWSPEDILYFVSDRSNWWNIYRYENGCPTNICPKDAEFGLPLWVFGMSTYAFMGKTIIATYASNGVGNIGIINTETGALKELETDYTDFAQVRSFQDAAYCIAGSPTLPRNIYKIDPENGQMKILSKAPALDYDHEYLSFAIPISFPSKNERKSHGFFYAPQNREFKGTADELPPLIVKSHGGPTANTSTVFDWKIQYWTSRGFAVLDVDYGGSTGYGRDYREQLSGTWGIVDVEDCEAGAAFLIQKGVVDPERTIITGGSAGGYTTLCALTFGKTFKMGASYYGVGDLKLLVAHTHKFESNYLEKLIGPFRKSEKTYVDRSPIEHIEKINTPIIFFQGQEDKVVPPEQAEDMYQALKAKGIKTELILFKDEQHGFRKAENIEECLVKELSFYLDVFSEAKKAKEKT